MRELASTLKNPPLTDFDENVISCSTSIGCWAHYAFFVPMYSTCSYSKSLIIMNVGENDGMCFGRSFKFSSSPFFIVAKHLNDSNFFCSMFLFSPEPSLFSWNSRGGLDASSSI